MSIRIPLNNTFAKCMEANYIFIYYIFANHAGHSVHNKSSNICTTILKAITKTPKKYYRKATVTPGYLQLQRLVELRLQDLTDFSFGITSCGPWWETCSVGQKLEHHNIPCLVSKANIYVCYLTVRQRNVSYRL